MINNNIKLANKMLLLVMMLFASHSTLASIYSWTDANGRKHFSSTPPTHTTSKKVTLKVNRYTNVTIDTSIFNTQGKVIMYSTSWCGYCKKAKRYFNANNIQFTEYDIEKSARAKRQYDRLNATGVPVILVGKKRLNGFSESAFKRIYNH